MNHKSNRLVSLSLSLSEKDNSLTNPNKKNAFTLLELIIVIIIVGILATLGLSQYTVIVEKGRLSEATAKIGAMRKLAYEYYLKNGSLDNMQNSDLGVNDTCASTHFYRYNLNTASTSTYAWLNAYRCTSGGKAPNVSMEYVYGIQYFPDTGQTDQYCYYSSGHSSCFGYPPFP